ncbi:hypothetical protein [Nostoc sp.]|uniref:hypothetical protein n=1 Tax=Nostoc sp. TaxID=1180 RepID=UPI002FF4CC09
MTITLFRLYRSKPTLTAANVPSIESDSGTATILPEPLIVLVKTPGRNNNWAEQGNR